MRIRISQFSGEAPRLSPFALPEQMAAVGFQPRNSLSSGQTTVMMNQVQALQF